MADTEQASRLFKEGYFDNAIKERISNGDFDIASRERYEAMTSPLARPSILNFARIMELDMREHDIDRGDDWMSMPIRDLTMRLFDELKELRNEYYKFHNDWKIPEGILKELEDMANILMMLWNRLREMGEADEDCCEAKWMMVRLMASEVNPHAR